MDILFLCKTLPHEKVIGGPILVYNRVRILSRRHNVSLLCFVPEEEREYQDSVARFCLDYRGVPMPGPRPFPRKAWDFLFSPVPIYFLNSRSPLMFEALREMVGKHCYDVVVSEYSAVAQYLFRNPDLAGMKRVMSVHECYYLARRKAWRVQRFSREGVSALFNLKGLRRFEFEMYADADLVLTLTPEGRQELLDIRPDLRIEVVPHGVDVERFCVSGECEKEEAVMFLGNYPHDPNRDAVLYFHQRMWPRIRREVPSARFYVVGKDPTPDLLELAREDPSVVVTGTVEDVRPYFERSKVFVNPVRIGGGFRGKLLEAMAMGLPIVTTSLGAEGVEAEDGRDMVIADDPEEFAAAVIRLLRDDELCCRLGDSARRLAEERFSWEKGVERLERVLLDLVEKG
ncbi:glycosyltransferase [Candidatus Solincola tengchongensis]|uniref:glycosyltransferase n=1 Tax=Candidatus Solincola tengchongensis TaxID=2900693 RepID=UPI00257B2A0A|nr:glycosyltransferase [Candidatus Solincola tengchongensis]